MSAYKAIRRRIALLGCATLVALALRVRADEAPTATIRVSSATAGSSIGHLVEGVLTFRDRDYLLTLHGVTGPTQSRGVVYGLARVRDIEGHFKPSGDALRNSQGVVLRLDPPLPLGPDGLEVEVAAGMQPKVSRGAPGEGVEQ